MFLLVKRVLSILLVTKMIKKVRPSCILFPELSGCRRDFDKNKCMDFLIKDYELMEKDNEILGVIASKKDLIMNLYTMKYI